MKETAFIFPPPYPQRKIEQKWFKIKFQWDRWYNLKIGGGGINKYFQVVSITAVILSFSKACLSLVINKQQLKA